MKPELLIGVGSFSGAIAAVKSGADAVYFGVKGYNMRDLGTNFKASEMKKLLSVLPKNKSIIIINESPEPVDDSIKSLNFL